MSNHYPQTRSDFRCVLCQRKNVFHCEHDTPYRDRYLGAYDINSSQNHNNRSRKSKDDNRIHYNSTTNVGSTTRQQINSNDGGSTTRQQINTNDGVQYQQNQTLHTRTSTNTSESSKKHGKKKETKSCVII